MTRPFHEVIKELASNEIIPLDDSEFGKDELCATLQRVASKAAADMTEKPIVRPRPNEVGNDIEIYVKDALEIEPEIAVMPMGPSVGYPDIKTQLLRTQEIVFLECKTFGTGKETSSMRTFYLSPGPAVRLKVDCDAMHIAISYEMNRQGNDNTPLSYKLIDLYDLPCNLKQEWQSSNKELYADERVLLSGKC